MKTPFIYETHGVHVGTGKDHVKHGADDIEAVIERAIESGFPGVTFVIHAPRLTRFRYEAEKNTDIKFIRGDSAYFKYPDKMAEMRAKYNGKIKIRYGIELEWLGPGLGIQWNRSKVFQACGADFVIGSVHFSTEGIPYDGSKEEAEKLIDLRGGVENYWAGYIEEMIEMINASWDMIQVIGHLDLPKLYVPIPGPLMELDRSSHFLARRMRVLLEMIASYNLALDVNLAGLRKGCGIYPNTEILKRAHQLEIPVAVGTDAHSAKELGINYKEGIEYLQEAGYKYYVSFSKGIPEKRPFVKGEREVRKFRVLNLAIEMLNRRFEGRKRIGLPKFAFGGAFKTFMEEYVDSVSLGEYRAVRVRKSEKSITISDQPPENESETFKGLFSFHKDAPGVLSILLNTLASEEINVDTAFLHSLHDGTATAYLTLSGKEERVVEVVDFVKGTAGDKFFELELEKEMKLLLYKEGPAYLLEVDGVDLPIPISRQMILSVHNNSPGVLLILLSALASRNIQVYDLQLGKRGDKGYAILGVEGDENTIRDVLTRLGSQYHEVSYLALSSVEEFTESLF
ncbi:MAG: histidinol-phosphatase HisJ family protein [bacterium]|nr:histidinol-phosphatase HisJ family protein [bacterium]